MIDRRAPRLHLRAVRYGGHVGGQRRGFSLLELLIATAISTLFAAAVAMMVPSLQAFFEQTPATLDVQQRGRTALDAVTQAVRAADKVLLLDPYPSEDVFRELTTIAPKLRGAQGVTAADQPDPGEALRLLDSGCPNVPDVCGFVRDSVALITDADGEFDVFAIRSLDETTSTITPREPFDRTYAAGAAVIEVEVYTFRLDPRPDGGFDLVRETAAGAVQPIVDRVSDLRFARTLDGRGVDVTITLQRHGTAAGEITRRVAVASRNVR